MALEQIAFGHIETLKQARDADDVFAELKKFGSSFGLDGFLLTGVPDPGEALKEMVVLSGWNPGWLKRYDERDYVHVDPVARFLRGATQPFRWSNVAIDAGDTIGQRVMNEAGEFGMNDGICVPVIDYRGNQSVVSFGAKHYELSEREESVVQLVSLFAFSEACARLKPRSDRDSLGLTPRQIEVLKWMALGKSNWEIGQITGLTERSVETYVKRIARALNVSNRAHAVAQGFRGGILH